MANRKPAFLKPQRRCIFCDGAPVTKEHIWSEWTYQYLPKRRGSHQRTIWETSKSTPTIGGIRETKKHQGEVNAHQIKAVCATCNNGWMSLLEARVKATLVPLMLGQAAVLSPLARETLAAWVAMKCMVIEQSNPSDAVTTPAERSHVKATRTAPPNWKVWIAHQHGKKWRTGFIRCALTMGSAPEGQIPTPPNRDFSKNTQSMTLGFGSLLVHVVSTRVEGLDLRLGPELDRALHQVWPSGPGFLWPSRTIITDAGIETMAFALNKFAREHQWLPIP